MNQKGQIIYDPEEKAFYMNGKLISNCHYDKNQRLYTTKFYHNSYVKGFKFLYGKTPEGIRIQIEKEFNYDTKRTGN